MTGGSDFTGAVVTTPGYFGPDDAPLFGAISYPASGRVRAGVLLCPSVGKEQAETTRGLKLFAERLAARGFAVLRFDYACTGESPGAQYQQDAADAWLASVGVAADALRAMGAARIVAVGHRAGALLLAHANTVGPLDALVVWDPVIKGRQYIRAKTVLYNMVTETAAPGDVLLSPTGVAPAALGYDPQVDYVNTAGQSLHPQTAARFGGLTLPADVGASLPPDRVLAVVRGSDRDGRFARSQSERGVAILEIGDQEPFLEPGHPAVLTFPTTEFAEIADWIDAAVAEDTAPIAVDLRDAAVVARADDGRPIVTRLLSAGRAWVWDTAIAGEHDSAWAVFVAHSLGQYVRTGPSRLYYETGLAVAARGGRSVRYDRPTVGESGTAAMTDALLPLYTRDYLDDANAVIAGLPMPSAAAVAQSGICVGSWMAAHGALHLRSIRPDVNSIAVLVNPLWWRLNPVRSFVPDEFIDGVDLAGTPTNPTAERFIDRVREAIVWRAGRLAPALRRAVPRRMWPAVARLPLIQFPDALFDTFAADGARLRLVFAPGDFRHFVDATDGMHAVQHAVDPVPTTATAIGDHTSYNIEVRRAVVQQVLDSLDLARPVAGVAAVAPQTEPAVVVAPSEPVVPQPTGERGEA